jgi:hypothetical protein
MFENTNDPAFQKRLDMMSNAVSYSMRVMLVGARGGPLLCRAEVSNGLRPKMELNLDCAGTLIPFRLEFRPDREDWILTEEDAAPEIFTRLRN